MIAEEQLPNDVVSCTKHISYRCMHVHIYIYMYIYICIYIYVYICIYIYMYIYTPLSAFMTIMYHNGKSHIYTK